MISRYNGYSFSREICNSHQLYSGMFIGLENSKSIRMKTHKKESKADLNKHGDEVTNAQEREVKENEKIFPAEMDNAGTAGGDGYKKKGESTSSSRWGEEWLSTADVGQGPEKLRSPSERQLSGYDDNTTSVGQVGDRNHLTVVDRDEDSHQLPARKPYESDNDIHGGTQVGINKESAAPTGFGQGKTKLEEEKRKVKYT